MIVQPRPASVSSSPSPKASLHIARRRTWVGRVIARTAPGFHPPQPLLELAQVVVVEETVKYQCHRVRFSLTEGSTNHGAHYEMMMGPEDVAPVTEEEPAARR